MIGTLVRIDKAMARGIEHLAGARNAYSAFS